MNDDVPVEVQRAIIQQEIQLWKNTRYQLEIRCRVQQRIGGDISAIQAELEKCEKALDVLAELEESLHPASVMSSDSVKMTPV